MQNKTNHPTSPEVLTKDGEQFNQKWSVWNACRTERRNNEDNGHHRNGFLATVIPQEKYRIIISDAAWNYAAPANPGAYAAAALTPGVSSAQREQLVAQHKEEQMAYADYLWWSHHLICTIPTFKIYVFLTQKVAV